MSPVGHRRRIVAGIECEPRPKEAVNAKSRISRCSSDSSLSRLLTRNGVGPDMVWQPTIGRWDRLSDGNEQSPRLQDTRGGGGWSLGENGIHLIWFEKKTSETGGLKFAAD
jgi:hypothetical protein